MYSTVVTAPKFVDCEQLRIGSNVRTLDIDNLIKFCMYFYNGVAQMSMSS